MFFAAWFWRPFLVGGWTTHLKNMLVKMGSSSTRFGVKIKIFETTTQTNMIHHYLEGSKVEISQRFSATYSMAKLDLQFPWDPRPRAWTRLKPRSKQLSSSGTNEPLMVTYQGPKCNSIFPKIGGKPPKMDGLQWKTLLKWMIWVETPLFLVQHPTWKTQISSRLVDDTQLIRDLFGTQLHNLGGVKKWRHARGLLQQNKYSNTVIEGSLNSKLPTIWRVEKQWWKADEMK